MNKTLKELRYVTTVSLFALTIVTLGIYLIYYIRRQTRIINESDDRNHHVSNSIMLNVIGGGLTVGLHWILCGLLIHHFLRILVIPGLVLSRLMNFDLLVIDMYLIAWSPAWFFLLWAYDARDKLSVILGTNKTEELLLSGFFTFFFVMGCFNSRFFNDV